MNAIVNTETNRAALQDTRRNRIPYQSLHRRKHTQRHTNAQLHSLYSVAIRSNLYLMPYLAN